MERGVVVIGGGIGGVQASLDLANAGIKVILVERQPSIGGAMAQLDKTFPTNDCSMCILSPKLVEVARHPNIELLTNAEVTAVEGTAGEFDVTVTQHPRYVDMEKCIACGMCTEKCPSKVPSEFDRGMGDRKAIYAQFPQAVPLKWTIDAEHCIYLIKGKCGICAKVCPADAVDFEDTSKTIQVDASAIVASPGFASYDPSPLAEFGHGRYPNVITNLEFERMLNASGPTDGHLVRPADGEVPKRIAFLQCVGSRDDKAQRWCSSFCCMASIKEAVIAKEHAPDIERLHIYFMDIRAFGKEFEDFYVRAEEQHGIGFTRCRVPGLVEHPDTKDIHLDYVEEGTLEPSTAAYDLVVLSTGMSRPEGADELAGILDIDLTEEGFCSTDAATNLRTSREGVFVCGAFSGPKDIPETVAQASGAAGMAAAVHLATEERLPAAEQPPIERDVTGEEPRIGVFVCHCGTNIGGIVDVPGVAEFAKSLPGVVHSEDNLYSCSADAQEVIKDRIREHDLNRVVVASCTPRTHEPLFRATVREAGLNPYLFDLANIRDQCSWVHQKEPERATEKSKDLVTMAVSRANLLMPLDDASIAIIPKAMVMGGGLAGMTAALAIGEQGFDVHLVEREGSLGGNLKKVRLLMDGDPQDMVDDLIRRVNEHPQVNVHLGRHVENITGYVGNFTTSLSGGERLDHGVVVVATGGQSPEPSEYLYGEDPRVVTQLEFESQLAAAEDLPDSAVFIQCVGSRNDEHAWCSRICCGSTVKEALHLKGINPDADVYVIYRDVRTYGLREDAYREAAEKGVIFIRYEPDDPPVVSKEGDRLSVRIKDEVLGDTFAITAERVVLATAVLPRADNKDFAKMLKVPLSKDGFFLEAHVKLRPLDFATEGVFVCGMAHWPKTVDETAGQAYGVAARAATILSLNKLETEGIVSNPDPELCRGCGRCVGVCEYGAPELVETPPGVWVSQVNEVLCKGCGKCAVACPTKAISMRHFTDDQIDAMLEALLRGVS
jgi:heterodisulfide reductase subunit A